MKKEQAIETLVEKYGMNSEVAELLFEEALKEGMAIETLYKGFWLCL